MEITGRLCEILPQITGEGKNGPWFNQSIIIEIEGRYPKNLCVKFVGDKCDHILNMKIGEILTLHVEAESRKWTSKEGKENWFTDVTCWKVVHAEKQEKSPMGHSDDYDPDQAPPVSRQQSGQDESNDDDLPF